MTMRFVSPGRIILSRIKNLIAPFRCYTVTSLGPVGVRINDLDLTKPISLADKQSLRRDVVNHELLLFKRQNGITDKQTLQVAEIFGPLELKPQQGYLIII